MAVAESLTGGLLADAFAQMPDAGTWFKGGVVAYALDVKRDLLGIGDAPAVSADAATAMAVGVSRLLGAEVGIAVTGVGGPDAVDGVAPGTVWMGVAVERRVEPRLLRCDGPPIAVVHATCAAAIEAVSRALNDRER